MDVYHEFSHPEQMLAAMRQALKPEGLLVLVEFRAEDAEVPIQPLHKMSKEQIMKELPANGFRLAKAIRQVALAAPDVLRPRRAWNVRD